METNYLDIIRISRFYSDHSPVDDAYEYEMVSHFIELLGDKFNQMFEDTFLNDYNFDYNFYNFHKSMRQTDFFNMGNGHIDMLWWNFIQMSDATYKVLKTYYDKLKSTN